MQWDVSMGSAASLLGQTNVDANTMALSRWNLPRTSELKRHVVCPVVDYLNHVPC